MSRYMRQGDGLSRSAREEKIDAVRPFQIVDKDIDFLLCKVNKIITFVRYYNFNNYADQFWNGLFEEPRGQRAIHTFVRKGCPQEQDGNAEPSKALLFVFLRQLHGLNSRFNDRWKEFPHWFLNEVAGIESLEPLPDRVWVCFRKNMPGSVAIAGGERFQTVVKGDETAFIYRLNEDFTVQDLRVERAFSVWFEKRRHVFPASSLDVVTSLKINDLIGGAQGRGWMFSGEPGDSDAQSPGFMIASPSLLLREGKRSVTISFEAENLPLTSFIAAAVDPRLSLFDFSSEESKYARLLENIFYLQISTPEGWRVVRGYTTRCAEDCRDDIVLRFSLPEDFPATAACATETHGFESTYPALKVLLNLDAWLYPYSWIKNFLLRRIRIRTCVEDISNLLVYNDLGRIDNSRPFQPFGLNTERGAWFAAGSYEMAVRPVTSVNVRIQWGQLPGDEYGLKEYYAAYGMEIDNRSFRILPRFLTDYRWQLSTAEPFYIFATSRRQPFRAPAADLPLIRETCWRGIPVDRMTPTVVAEELYDYSIQSKTGFVSFLLTGPAMGFGEQRFRYLFSRQMMRDAGRKKTAALLNPPLVPVIDRITLDYVAEEIIDLRTHSPQERNRFYHLFPLGFKQVFPNSDNRSIPLVYTLESEANVMLGMRHVEGGERVRLYLDFVPVNKEIANWEIPQLQWFYGDGYTWKRMPDGAVENDTTRNLLTSGCVEFYLPQDAGEFRSPQTGLTWLRAGITEHHEYVPRLTGIYTNAAELTLEPDGVADGRLSSLQQAPTAIVPLGNLPGIAGVERISAFFGGRGRETDRERLIRVSEYVAHRGRAVTPRDYEQLTLQRFPAIAKVKCFPAMDTRQGRSGVVTLAVVPQTDRTTPLGWRPKAPANLILLIEEYLRQRVSAAVTAVDVVNPEYEELMVRCRVVFRKNHPAGASRRRLKALCDGLIAPWQAGRETPRFDHAVSLHTLYIRIRAEEYIQAVDELSVIRLAEKHEEHYDIHEYRREDAAICPSRPYVIFVPAREHLFLTETETPFGINEMTIDETFIIK